MALGGFGRVTWGRLAAAVVLMVGGAVVVGSPSGATGASVSSHADEVVASTHHGTHDHGANGTRARGAKYRKSDRLRTKLHGSRPAMDVTEDERATLRKANQALDDDHFNDSFDDPAMWVDGNGTMFHVDPQPSAPVTGPYVADPALSTQDLSKVFELHSAPGSSRTVFIDFDGGVIENTYWNSGIGSFTEPPFSLDEDRTSFSDEERAYILEVWTRVAEDYAPFNIDVTTQDPGFAAINRSNASDQVYGTRAMISQGPEIASDCGCGGIAYVGTVNTTVNHSKFQPAFVFPNYGVVFTADSISHETGHNFGLSHDGLRTSDGTFEYWSGNDLYDVIMGSGHGALSQWSKGTYAGANNHEDDLAVINAHGGAYRTDDHGNTAATATTLVGTDFSTSGIITSSSDVDVFSVTVGAGKLEVSALPIEAGPNLDISLELRDAAGSVVIAASDPPAVANWSRATGLAASISTSLSAGTYSLWVRGTGFGDQNTLGYPAYGSLGHYQLITGKPRLTVKVVGSGTVSADSGSIASCSTTCTDSFDLDSEVNLDIQPSAGWKVASIVGADGTRWWSTYVTMRSAERQVTVTFSPKPKFTVSAVKAGGGTGTVTSTPAGVDCGGTCSHQFVEGDSVGLEAVAGPNSVFTGWSGDCSGTYDSCSFYSLDADRSVTATFAPAYALTVNIVSEYAGAVDVREGGSTCEKWSSPCSTMLESGMAVTLTAQARYGYAFSSWGPSGACTGTSPTCTVTMSAAKSVTANFVSGRTLAVEPQSNDDYNGQASGDVETATEGLCQYTCYVTALKSATVTLTAKPRPWGRFTGWSGVCSGMSTACQVKMADIDDYDVATANFAPADVKQLDVSSSEVDRVTSSPPGIDCGAGKDACSAWFPTGTTVTLTATPGASRVVSSWGYELQQCTAPQSTCAITMTANATAYPEFDLTPYRVDVAKQGTGTGSVSSDVGGLACDTTCADGVAVGSKDSLITLTASPGPDSVFSGWAGACKNVTTVCSVRTSGPSAKRLYAKFASSAKPSAPTNTGVVPGSKQVLVSWVKPAKPGGAKIVDYVIERSMDGGPWVRIKDGKSTKTKFTVKSLRNGVPYRFRVAASSKWGLGPWVETLPVTPRTKPGAPSILLLTPGDQQLSVSWVPGTDGGSEILDYVLEYSTNGRRWTAVPHEVSTETSATIAGMVNATKYWVRVAMVNAAGTGARSKTKTAKPVLPPPLLSPLGIGWADRARRP